jgi:hypothetical protein
MPRFTFDIFWQKERFMLLPVKIVCRKRTDKKIPAEDGEQYIATIEASSYEDASEKLMDKLRQGWNK